MKTDLFQSCGHYWVFQICWHIECSTLTASSFRIWNSSAEILSPPRALFTVMLPKAHLTSHSRMSGCRWMTTPSWLSGSLKPFLYSSLYSCHLFCLMVECKWDSSVVAHGPEHVSPSLWRLMLSLYLITRSFSWQDCPGLEWSAPGWLSASYAMPLCFLFLHQTVTLAFSMGRLHLITPGLSSPDASSWSTCCASVDLTPPSNDEVLSPFPSPTSALLPCPL